MEHRTEVPHRSRVISAKMCGWKTRKIYLRWSVQFSPLNFNQLVLLPGLLLLLAYPGVTIAGPSGPGGPPPMVEVAPVTLQDVNPPQEYVGHMEAVQAVDLRARVEGFLEQVAFKEGSDVHTDELFYSIEQRPYAAQVAANKAMVAQAKPRRLSPSRVNT